ncbi:MAG: polymerase sigma70 factor [Flavipsychrobacter sp.]|nr:polymerase sigma70 factor [Flavipsychrobacter sp.]
MITQYERLIYKVCSVYASEAENRRDLFQEIVLQAWRGYPRFKEDAKVSTWLYRVALNTAISHRRKQNSTISTRPHDELLHQIADKNMEARSEEYKMLQRLISALPQLEKAIMLLYLEDKSYQEMAEILGLSAGNVGVKINRIKDKLRRQAQPLFK